MALKLKDLLQLNSMRGMKILAGEGGLDRIVCSAGIADYEFARGVVYDNEQPFEPSSFIISSLLFAQNDETQILDAIKTLWEMGTSGFAFKNVIFDAAPQEVIDFCNEKDYPLFVFGKEPYFEDIIFGITEAVQQDDTLILTEEKLTKMIENKLSKYEVEEISKSVSFMFKRFAMAAYLAPPAGGETGLDLARVFRNYYLNRNIRNKIMLCRYGKGIFIIMTGALEKEESFELILTETLENLAIDRNLVLVCRSGMHNPFERLDRCIRESYHTYVASISVEGRAYGAYQNIGIFRYLIPLKNHYALEQFSESVMRPFLNREELLQTVISFVVCNGDIGATATACNCHANTVRYRLSKVRELLGQEGATEQAFYEELSVAVRIYLLNRTIG
ncbi:MAG: PucR family transcriptional regulator [Firmicutes bacterium]|nr:PucR family transcriptional regulator [Bacillota bacterium]